MRFALLKCFQRQRRWSSTEKYSYKKAIVAKLMNVRNKVSNQIKIDVQSVIQTHSRTHHKTLPHIYTYIDLASALCAVFGYNAQHTNKYGLEIFISLKKTVR